MSKTKIEWSEETWNVTTGCTRVSSGCDNCYAVAMTKRLAGIQATKEKYSGLVNKNKNHFNGQIKLHPDELSKPLSWRKPRLVFVNSMSDLFHPDVPFDFIDKVFSVMALASNHTFQILTKRPERMAEYFNRFDTIGEWKNAFGYAYTEWKSKRTAEAVMNPDNVWDHLKYVDWPLPNVWLGTSCENQDAADERIPHLLKCPAAVRFLSCEPLLGPVDLTHIPIKTTDPSINVYNCLTGDHFDEDYDEWIEDEKLFGSIDWVIVGSESGYNRRECNFQWVRSIRDKCVTAETPFFLKQLYIKGKKIGTPALDGKIWDKFPEVYYDK